MGGTVIAAYVAMLATSPTAAPAGEPIEPVWQLLKISGSKESQYIDLSTAVLDGSERRFWVRYMGKKDEQTGKVPPLRFTHWILDCKHGSLGFDSTGEEDSTGQPNLRKVDAPPSAIFPGTVGALLMSVVCSPGWPTKPLQRGRQLYAKARKDVRASPDKDTAFKAMTSCFDAGFGAPSDVIDEWLIRCCTEKVKLPPPAASTETNAELEADAGPLVSEPPDPARTAGP